MARPPRALSVDFEWDAKKAIANAQRHGVTFDEASQVFADDHSSTVADPDHSAEEARFLIVGATKTGRFWVVSFTDRGARIRVINARPMIPRERRAYEQ
jgi:uncharacterized DUF497 family protein